MSESNSAFRGRYTYTSREWDSELQLQFHRARYYDPRTARWISRDPIGFEAGDGNLYRYVANVLTTKTDPSGLQGLPPPPIIFTPQMPSVTEGWGQKFTGGTGGLGGSGGGMPIGGGMLGGGMPIGGGVPGGMPTGDSFMKGLRKDAKDAGLSFGNFDTPPPPMVEVKLEQIAEEPVGPAHKVVLYKAEGIGYITEYQKALEYTTFSELKVSYRIPTKWTTIEVGRPGEKQSVDQILDFSAKKLKARVDYEGSATFFWAYGGGKRVPFWGQAMKAADGKWFQAFVWGPVEVYLELSLLKAGANLANRGIRLLRQAPARSAVTLGVGESGWVVRNASNAAEIDAAINAAGNQVRRGGTAFLGEADAHIAARANLIREQPGFRDIVIHAHTNIGPGEALPTFFINGRMGMVPVTTEEVARVVNSLSLPNGMGIRIISCGGGSSGMEGVNLAADLARLTRRRVLASDAPVQILKTGELRLIEQIKGWHIVNPGGSIEPLIIAP